MILLLSERTSEPAIQTSRRNALVVMVPSFFGLLIVSFSFAVTMGEVNCKRAEAATISTAGLFAVSAVGTMYALVWLFHAYEKGFRALSTISGSVVFIVSAMVFTQMGLTVIDFQDKYAKDHLHNSVIWIYIAVNVTAVLCLWLRWMIRKPPSKEHKSTSSAVAIIIYCLVAVPLFNIVIAFPVSDWNGEAAPWYAIFAAITSLVGISAPIYLMLFTTPHRDGVKSRRRGLPTAHEHPLSPPPDGKTLSLSIRMTEDHERDKQISASVHLPD